MFEAHNNRRIIVIGLVLILGVSFLFTGYNVFGANPVPTGTSTPVPTATPTTTPLPTHIPTTPPSAEDSKAFIVVHMHNPEGVELASIEKVNWSSVQVYDGSTLIGNGVNNVGAHNDPIWISTGPHTIKAKFNGINMEQNINLNPGETKVLTFTFPRIEYPILSHVTWGEGRDVLINIPPQNFLYWYIQLQQTALQEGGFDCIFYHPAGGEQYSHTYIDYWTRLPMPWNYVTISPMPGQWSYSFGDYGTGNYIDETDANAISVFRYHTSHSIGYDKPANWAALTIHFFKMSSIPYDITGTGVREEANQQPIASFTFSPEIPLRGRAINFDASLSSDPDGTITNYTWDYGDGSTGAGKMPIHTYYSNDTYLVVLTVTDDNGNQRFTGKTLTVQEPNIGPIIKNIRMYSFGKSISAANIAEPYTIVVTLENPDTIAHDYNLQLTPNSDRPASRMEGAVLTGGFPKWLRDGMEYAGFNSFWTTDPHSKISSEFQLTVEPRATAEFKFEVESDWNWIPPWDAKYFVSSYVWGITGGVLPTVGAVSDWVSVSSAFANAGWIIPVEEFNFKLLSGSTSIRDFSFPVVVPFPGTKATAYIGSVVASSVSGMATVVGMATSEFGVGVVFIATQAAMIVTQNVLYQVANDPSPSYTQVVQLAPFALNNGTVFMDLSVMHSLSVSERELLQTYAKAFSYLNATAISQIRYYGAIEAGDQHYADLQFQAIINYGSKRDQYMAAFADQFKTLISQMPELNANSLQNAQNYIKQNGLPPLEQELLTGLGLSSSIDDVTQASALFNSTLINESSLIAGVQSLQMALAAETNVWKEVQAQAEELKTPMPSTSPDTNYANIIYAAIAVAIIAGVSTTALLFSKRVRKMRAKAN